MDDRNAIGSHQFTVKIVVGMVLGIMVGVILQYGFPDSAWKSVLIDDWLSSGGDIFLNLIKMLVVPIVFVSIVCGSAGMRDFSSMGRIGIKSLFLYLLTTLCAISLAIIVADLFKIGHGVASVQQAAFEMPIAPGIKHVFVNIFPSNPVQALANGNMLQIVVFALLFGGACALAGERAKSVNTLFQSLNQVLMKLVTMVMKLTPYGVFCLLAVQFSALSAMAILHVLGYFMTVLLVLLLQVSVVYPLFLMAVARVNPLLFYKKMYAALLFAFSVSSSNASIPVVLETVEKKLGVKNKVASFVIPIGATINMDGTAIMQGVATVFVAHLFHVPMGLEAYLTVILMATLASIGTAGVPSVGLLTLAMVFQQVGLPVEGISLIIGVDRLLDMVRTAVNISGDSMVAVLVGHSEQALDRDVLLSHD